MVAASGEPASKMLLVNQLYAAQNPKQRGTPRFRRHRIRPEEPSTSPRFHKTVMHTAAQANRLSF
jgi:hypothetical protein